MAGIGLRLVGCVDDAFVAIGLLLVGVIVGRGRGETDDTLYIVAESEILLSSTLQAFGRGLSRWTGRFFYLLVEYFLFVAIALMICQIALTGTDILVSVCCNLI